MRIMAMRSFTFLVLIVQAAIIQVHCELDSHGFLSIDCGYANSLASYNDPATNLTYVSDDSFIKTGSTKNIASSYMALSLSKEYETVRYFPDGNGNCYSINPLTVGLNHLLRATFFYGNYDGLNKPPIFEIYLGIILWDTVNASSASFPEIIFTALNTSVQVCLKNIGQGVPFISSIHLRQLKARMYQYVNSTSSLILLSRNNLGGSNAITRYSDDIFDRWWLNDTFNSAWNYIPISSKLNYSDPDFEVPPAVIQTAATTSRIQEPLTFYWNIDSHTKYYWVFYFYDVQMPTGRREFNIFINGAKTFDEPTIPSEPESWLWVSHWDLGNSYCNVSLVPTLNSTLPPLLNGFEMYRVAPVILYPTYPPDVAAINRIKVQYKIDKGWINDDPCFSTTGRWVGVECSADFTTETTRIIGLYLASSGLTGPFVNYYGNLTALEALDLSKNNLSESLPSSLGQLTYLRFLNLSSNALSGSLPSSLDNLHNLTYLDITGNNQLKTALPPELQKKQQGGFINYRFDTTNSTTAPPPPPPPPPPHSPKNYVVPITIAVLAPLLVVIVAIVTVFWWKRKYYGTYAEHIWKLEGAEQNFAKFESRQFSYNDLKRITNSFENKIGTGGFGNVYLGILEDGVQVAVKIHSNLSAQGVKELLAEAESLTRVHHKYLVALVGYCISRSCMALVYEFMQEGNLYEKLKDDENHISWRQRLQIAYESALGLEYLHKACNPPLIHRDVKTSNILLTGSLQAKIADFGLSRAFNNPAISHVSTRVVGTPGYLDPEYYQSTGQLTIKSDVFSFGVVLLEIITGQPPIMVDLEGSNLVQWVRHKLSEGDIQSIVDPRMQDKYDINSIWKVTNLACKCTELRSSERPTMTEVATELKECLDLEISIEEMDCKSIDNSITNVSLDNTFEMAYSGSMPAPSSNEI